MARLSDLFVSIKADDSKASKTILGIRRQLTNVDKTKVSPKITLPAEAAKTVEAFQKRLASLNKTQVNLTVNASTIKGEISTLEKQLAELKSKRVEVPVELQEKVNKEISETESKLDGLRKKRTEVPVELQDKADAEIKRVEKQLEKLQARRTKLPLEVQDKEAEAQIREVEAALTRAQRKQTQIPLKLERVGSQISAVEGQLNAAGGKFSKAGTAAGDKFGSGFGGRVKEVLAGIGIASFSGAVVGGLGKAVKTAGDFDQTMRTVGVTLGEGEKGVKSLTALAVEMGSKTSFSAKGASDAMLELAKGGLSSAQIEAGALNSTLTLATAGGLDLGDAATYMVNGLNAFKISAKDSNSVAAALAGAANASTASVESLGMGLSQTASQASTAGLSLQDTVAALAAFDNAGIKGSDAGTSLKVMLQRLVPQTEKQWGAFYDLNLATFNTSRAMEILRENGVKPLGSDAATLEGQMKTLAAKLSDTKEGSATANAEYTKLALASGTLGTKFFDAAGNARSMAEISGELATALKGQTKEQKIATLNTLFGSDASRAAGILAETGAKKIGEYAAAAKDQSQANLLAANATAGFSGALERVQGAAETFGIQVGTKLLPPLSKFLDVLSSKVIPGLSKFFEFVGGHSTEFKVLGAAVALVTGAVIAQNIALSVTAAGGIAKYLLSTKLVTAATKAWSAVQFVLNAVLTANPIALVVVGLAALVAGVIYAYKHSETFRKVVDKVGAALKAAFVVALASVKVAIAAIVKAFIAVRDTTAEVWATVKGVVVGAWQGIVAFFSGAGAAVSGAVGAVWEKVKTVTLGVLTAVVTAVSGAWAKTVAVTKTLLAPVVAVVKTIIGGFVTVFKVAFTAIGVLNVLFWGAISKVTSAAFTAVKDKVITPVWNAVSAIFTKVQDTISKAFGKFWGGIKSVATTAFVFYRDKIITPVWNKVSSIFSTVQTAITTAFTKFWSGIKSIATTAFVFYRDKIVLPIWTKVTSLFSTAQTAISKAFTAFWTTIKTTATTYFTAIKTTIDTALGKVKGYFSTAQTKVSTAWTGFWTGIKSTAGTAIDKVKEKVDTVLGKIKGSFDTAKTNIKTAWNGIKSVVSAPIEWVKNNVYNKPLVPVWNRVADLVNGPKLSAYARGGIAEAERYANGGTPFGVRPGYTPGRDTHTIQVGGGEAIMRPEFTRGVGPAFIHAANKAARTGGVSAVRALIAQQSDMLSGMPSVEGREYPTSGKPPGFAGGGIVGWLKRSVGTVKDVLGGALGNLKDWALGGLRNAAGKILTPLSNAISGAMPDSGVGRTAGGIGKRAISLLLDKIKSSEDKKVADDAGSGPYGGGGAAVGGGRGAARLAGLRLGATSVGTYPGHQPSMNKAWDFMINSRGVGDLIAGHLAKNRKQYGISYLIWYRQMLRDYPHGSIPPGTWAPYFDGNSSNPNRAHTNHVHASFYNKGGIVPMAQGGLVKGGRGGITAQVGEGKFDELVTPLPRNWQTKGDAKMDRLLALLEARGAGEVVINLGGVHNPLPETASQTTNRVLQRVSSLGLV